MRRSPFKPGDPSAVQFTKEPLERLSSVFYGSEWDGKSSILGLCIPWPSVYYIEATMCFFFSKRFSPSTTMGMTQLGSTFTCPTNTIRFDLNCTTWLDFNCTTFFINWTSRGVILPGKKAEFQRAQSSCRICTARLNERTLTLIAHCAKLTNLIKIFNLLISPDLREAGEGLL